MLVMDVLYWITAAGIVSMSRAAFVFGLFLLIVPSVLNPIILRQAPKLTLIVFFYLLAFINSIRGTFAFHEYMARKDVRH